MDQSASIAALMGPALQARTIPEHVKRAAEAQARMVSLILENTYEGAGTAFRVTHTFLRHQEKVDPSTGLPVYGIVTHGVFPGVVATTEQLDAALDAALSRYGALAYQGESFVSSVATGLTWGLWLEGEAAARLVRQELPAFTAPADYLGEVTLKLQSPIFRLDLDTIREDGETCGAFLYMVPEDPKTLKAVMPVTGGEPEPQRWEWLESQLRDWEILEVKVGIMPTGAAYESLIQGPLQERLLWEKAPDYLVASRIWGDGVKYVAQDVAPDLDRCLAVLGESRRTKYDGGKWEYHLMVEDALFVVEGLDSEGVSVYALTGERPVAGLFREFCRLLSG